MVVGVAERIAAAIKRMRACNPQSAVNKIIRFHFEKCLRTAQVDDAMFRENCSEWQPFLENVGSRGAREERQKNFDCAEFHSCLRSIPDENHLAKVEVASLLTFQNFQVQPCFMKRFK